MNPKLENLKFKIVFTVQNDNEFISMDKLESDDLVQLLSQFQIALAMWTRRVNERSELDRLHSIKDDDIPF